MKIATVQKEQLWEEKKARLLETKEKGSSIDSVQETGLIFIEKTSTNREDARLKNINFQIWVHACYMNP